MNPPKQTGKTVGVLGVGVRIRSDSFCRKRRGLVLYQSPAGLARHRTGHGGEGLALRLLLASAQRQLGI